MRRIGLIIALLAILAGFAWPASRSVQAKPALDDPLGLTGQLTYDVRPDNGPVTVTWQVNLENNDPETVFRDVGVVYSYRGISLPVLRGASNMRISGPGGGALGFSLEDPGEGPIVQADINFDRNLYFGQTYSFTITYQLAETRSDFLLITPFYIYLPAIALGDSTTVSIKTPEGSAWDVSLDPGDCSESGAGTYQCGASEFLQVAAVVEVSRPDALLSTESTVLLSTSELTITIQYFPGEDAWATHIQEIASAALPALEELFGFPYQGATIVEIAERGRQDVLGYEGIFECQGDPCRIGISPLADDRVAVHEFAHLWTQSYNQRWLAEGLAQFATERIVAQLGPLISTGERIPPDEPVDLQLHDWGPAVNLIGASDEQRAREETGYQKSFRFFEVLNQTVGLEALQSANAAGVEFGRHVDSRAYLDLLEEASGANLAAFFLEWVFPSLFESVLEQRRAVRDRLVELRQVVDEVGLKLPPSIDKLVGDWRFSSAEDAIDEADGALAAYTVAQDQVEAPRNLLEKFGLLNKDPDALLADARLSFAVGEFERAIEQAEEAQDMVEDAGRTGLYRLLVAVVMFVIVVGGGIFLFLRRPRRSSYLSS